MKDLGFVGDTKACSRILDSTYKPLDELDICSKLLIKYLKWPLHITNYLNAVLSIVVFKQGWLKIQEKH